MNKLLISACGVSTVAIASLAVSTSAQALTFPSPSTCELGFVIGFSDCSGRVTGNDNLLLTELNNGITPSLNGTFATLKDNWSFLGKSDDNNSGPFQSNVEQPTGILDFDDALNGTYAISLKAANGFNVYLLQNLVNVTSLDFATGSFNRNNIMQDLSHASLYKYTDSQPVPEPLTILGTGLALGLGGLFKSKQKRKSEV